MAVHFVTHHGEYYVVENARIYTLPDEPPKVYMSALGRKAVQVAARIADGYIGITPDRELCDLYANEVLPRVRRRETVGA